MAFNREDGKTKAVYTFFFPTTKSFIRQTPQDVADPLALDFDFRRTVFARHFARQLISFDDLNKLDTILMADSKEATVTRDAGKYSLCLLRYKKILFTKMRKPNFYE